MQNIHFVNFDKSKELNGILNCYHTLNLNGKIKIDDFEFNNYQGDVTKDIIWTWAINKSSYDIFIMFFDKINLINNLNLLFNNKFKILGISFITILKEEILEEDTSFHYDILSPYDKSNQTNILTVLIPLIFTDDMGGLEYMIDDKVFKYKYNLGEYIAFDSSKVKHRTSPYKLDSKKKRVLLSINLSSYIIWASAATKSNTFHQGNIVKN